MEEAAAIIGLGIALMLPAIWELWSLLKLGYTMRWPQPCESGLDLEGIIEDLREYINALHTEL